MAIGAVVEITVGPDGTLPEQLIATAYRASWKSEIVLLLREVERARVDRLLDLIIAAHGLSRCGVRYLEDDDSPTVHQILRTARVVIASSERLRARLHAWGIHSRTLLDIAA